MDTYFFKATSKSGKKVVGKRTVVSYEALLEAMDSEGLQLIQCKRTYKLSLLLKIYHKIFTKLASRFSQKTSLQPKQSHLLIKRLYMLIKINVPMLDVMNECVKLESNRKIKNSLIKARDLIANGEYFSIAIKQTQLFDSFTTTIIKTGEINARLPEALDQLCQWHIWQEAVKKRLRKIITYPLIVFVSLSSVFLFLLIFIIPDLFSFITEFSNQTLPWYSQGLLWLSNSLTNNWLIITCIALVGCLALLSLLKIKLIKIKFSSLILKIPLLGAANYQFKLAVFMHNLGQLLQSNINVATALSLCQEITGNAYFAECISKMAKQVATDKTLAESFANSGLFEPLALNLIKTGEISGNLEQALFNVSELLDRQAQARLNKIEPVLGPALILISALLLLQMLLGLLTPIWDLMAVIN